MRVLYAILCEEAFQDPAAGLVLRGIFHERSAPDFPAQDSMALAVAVEWDDDEAGEREFSIDIEDPMAAPVGTLLVQTSVYRRRAEEEPSPRTPLLYRLEDVKFKTPGRYEFVMRYGAQRIALTPLHILHQPADQEA